MAIGQRNGRGGDRLPAPLILLILSLFVLMAFETGQAIHDHAALTALRNSQEPTMQQAARVRQQLQSLATKTAALAEAGDAGAENVVAQMKRQGITLSVPKK